MELMTNLLRVLFIYILIVCCILTGKCSYNIDKLQDTQQNLLTITQQQEKQIRDLQWQIDRLSQDDKALIELIHAIAFKKGTNNVEKIKP